MADPVSDAPSSPASISSSPPRPTLLWGFAAACTAFFWSLVSVSSQVAPAIFPVLVRGVGLDEFPNSFFLVSPIVDQLVLIVSAALVMVVLELRLPGLSYLSRYLFLVPAVMLALSFLMPAALLTFGGLGTMVAILYAILDGPYIFGTSPGKALSSVLVFLASSVALLSVVSMGRWVLNAADGLTPLKGWTWAPSVLLLRLLNQPYWLLPRLFVVLSLAWAMRLVLALYREEISRFFLRLSSRFGSRVAPTEWMQVSERAPLYLLLASLAAALFVGVYPYLPAINVDSTLVGFDVRTSYYNAILTMLNSSPSQAFGFAFANDRAGAFILQYAVACFFGSADFAVRVFPAILAVLLTITTYFFAKAGFGDRLLAATAALFAASSFIVVAGINGGLDASWLGDSEALVFFSILLVGLNEPDRRLVALSAVPSILLLFTHPWTWSLAMAVLVFYLLFSVVQSHLAHSKETLRFEFTSVGAVLLVNLLADVAKRLAAGHSGAQDVYSSSVAQLSLGNIPQTVGSLQTTVSIFLGGALDNSLIVILAIIGVLSIPDLHSRMSKLLLSWVGVASSVLLLAGFSAEFLHARIILLVPLQVLAALGFLSTLRYLLGLMSEGGRKNLGMVRTLVILAYVSLFAALMSYALGNVGFLYTGS